MSEMTPVASLPEVLIADLRQLIAEARRQAAVAVNVGLTLLYWRLGDRIRREVLGLERAGYGEQIVATLSHELVRDYGRGFERTNLTRMIKFAEAFVRLFSSFRSPTERSKRTRLPDHSVCQHLPS